MPTDIEWTHFPGTIGETWNPINATRLDSGKRGWHCEKVSPGCANCYAETFNGRNLPACGTGLDYTVPNRALVQIGIHEDTWRKPLFWKKPRTVFVCSMTDLFADFVPNQIIDAVFAIVALCPEHRFIVLTKRAKRMREYFAGLTIERVEADEEFVEKDFFHVPRWQGTTTYEWPLPNLILGVSVENQRYADERIPELLETPAACRFLSVEPMLGPVDLQNHPMFWKSNARLGWVIVGGESGPGARPMHPDWARALRDQCTAASVPYFFKQRGEWDWDQVDVGVEGESEATPYVNLDGEMGAGWVLDSDPEVVSNYCGPEPLESSVWLRRVGKKRAGRLLDGREWSEFPKMLEAGR